MTTIFAHEMFQKHLTGKHPECPDRLIAIEAALRTHGTLDHTQNGAIKAASPDLIAAIHRHDQIELVEALARSGGGSLDPDTIVSPSSYEVALYAAGTAAAAVDCVLNNQIDNRALCLIRPPGHHASQNLSMGFCLFNNVAIAARYAQKKYAVERVLIIDWDVHHGNGTQDIFYEDPSVFFYSLHRYPFYPGTGAEDEVGTGKGRGTTKNSPIKFGTSREIYLSTIAKDCEFLFNKHKPQLVLISAGFDAVKTDPVGSLGLEPEDFATMTDIVCNLTESMSNIPIISCLEGGYDLLALGDCVKYHLKSLSK